MTVMAAQRAPRSRGRCFNAGIPSEPLPLPWIHSTGALVAGQVPHPVVKVVAESAKHASMAVTVDSGTFAGH